MTNKSIQPKEEDGKYFPGPLTLLQLLVLLAVLGVVLTVLMQYFFN